MKLLCLLTGSFLLAFSFRLSAEEAKKTKSETYQVPYRLTDTYHVLVRAKINGKGPFNFILDTGAPFLFVSTAVAKKLGIEPDPKRLNTFERFEIEGGVVVGNAKGRIEDPFQLEGMNGLGLAGVHLDGIIGYNILARYRVEYDFTKDKLAWTALDFEPPLPKGLGIQGGAPGGLDALGAIMKFAGALLGKKPQPELILPGFFGLQLADVDGAVEIQNILAQGPAAKAGLQAHDRIQEFQGTKVNSVADFRKRAMKLVSAQSVRLTLKRGLETKQVTIELGKGL
jgi:membrane-associated protease RseP (regulator of RpoE activity)